MKGFFSLCLCPALGQCDRGWTCRKPSCTSMLGWGGLSATCSSGRCPCPGQVQVWDTAGQERFRKSMVEHYYRNVHAVVFVYDVTKMSSFTNLKTWIEECNGHAVPALVPRVLVGNKCDLKDLIQVPSSMALKFADAHNMLLFETSAKDPQESQNVDAIFMCLACRLKAQRSLLCRDLEGRPGPGRRLPPGHDGAGKSSCPC
ncbi:ras-related protein Rab-33A isoform X2 [Melanerpes formicivorus]|uniref:ras-related protein Rab-33A isoform X2 n=1 Tax=Melanerpes formicivorus TaxID=211600 RepID=UPI00358E7D3C